MGIEKTMEHAGDNRTNCNGVFGTVAKRLLKGLEDFEVGGRMENIQTTSFIEKGQNTEKTPGDLKRLSVTQTPVKDHQR